MKVQKPSHRKSNTKLLAILSFIVLMVATLSVFSLEKYQVTNIFGNQSGSSENANQVKIDYNKPSSDQIDAGKNIKDNSSDQITTPEGDYTVVISSLFSDDNNLYVRAIINGAITSSGTCELSITNSAGNILEGLTANTYAMPSYSTCQGFDINKSELTNGNLKVMLNVTIDGKVSSTEQEYKLE